MNQTGDQDTSVEQLKQLVADFVRERDWEQFHSPKNISMALAIEAAELMEHFQWISMSESRACRQEPEKLAEVGEELADILCYVLAMANQLELDLATTVSQKMEKNRLKYPAQDFQGRYGHKHRLPGTESSGEESL
ncbi:MAG: nucleotide pyrophosphohydrolase [Planctomycetota bacterium]|nr:nucleotide pyrophosphohydrolase [Planctomycetota bacterium]